MGRGVVEHDGVLFQRVFSWTIWPSLPFPGVPMVWLTIPSFLLKGPLMQSSPRTTIIMLTLFATYTRPVIHSQGRIQDFWKGGGVQIRSTSKKGGGRRGSNFGPNVKKPTSWHKRGGGADPLDPPPLGPPLIPPVYCTLINKVSFNFLHQNQINTTFY